MFSCYVMLVQKLINNIIIIYNISTFEYTFLIIITYMDGYFYV